MQRVWNDSNGKNDIRDRKSYLFFEINERNARDIQSRADGYYYYEKSLKQRRVGFIKRSSDLIEMVQSIERNQFFDDR